MIRAEYAAVLVLALAACSPVDGDRDGAEGASTAGPTTAATAIAETSVAAPANLGDSLAAWYALGINAHHLCAGLWVVGRDHQRSPEAVIAQDIALFPAFRWGSDYTYAVDGEVGRATVTQPGVGSRSASYSGDQGCAILPTAADAPYFAPLDLASNLPEPDAQDWPTGDRGAAATFPALDTDALEAALDFAFDDDELDVPQYTRGIVVVYRGKIIAERYADGWGPYTPQISWSMGKSIAAALTGVLIQQGEFTLDDPAPIPEWSGPLDPRNRIRIRDLLHMSSGLDFDNFGLDPRSSYNAANEHFRIYFDAVDVYLHSINQPARFAPDEIFRYRNSDPLSLMAVARAKVEARGETFLEFPQRQLFDRIGVRSMVLETDAWGNFIVTGYDYGGSRDWARFGLLHLWDGVWEGERILPEGWSEFVSTPANGDPRRGYGGLWWLNRGGAMDRVPEDAYWAAGYMGQRTMVIPSRDVVIVRHGPSPNGFDPYFNQVVGEILEAIPRG